MYWQFQIATSNSFLQFKAAVVSKIIECIKIRNYLVYFFIKNDNNKNFGRKLLNIR